MSKLISVIVPVYKCERYLRVCLDSIVNQTYRNIEVFLIDDESPDGSGTICEEYSKKYEYIKTIHQPNRGCGFSRNTGLEVMQGDYYTFIDADDYVALDYLEKMVTVAEEHNADMVVMGTLFMLETRNEYKRNTKNIEVYDVDETKNRDKVSAPSWGKLYKTSTLGHLRYDRASYEDVPYAKMICPLVKRVVFVNYSKYVYRAYQDSITRGNFGKKRINALIDAFGSPANVEWVKDAIDVLGIVEYRGQEILYKKYLKKLFILIDSNIEELKTTDSYNKMNTLREKAESRMKCGIAKYVFVKMKHTVALICSKYKVITKYKVRLKYERET